MLLKDFRAYHPLACLFTLTLVLLLSACDEQQSDTVAESDPKAVEIANEVIEAVGGRENWEKTRYVTWRFLDKRLHVWDKYTGRIRVESIGSTILMNVNTMEGRAWKNGEELHGDDLQRALDYGYEAWVNDTYWIFLPFKLRDPGVILKYVGKEELEETGTADILSLTFDDVGRTPENKYHVYIDRDSKLLVRWDYYENENDPHPRFNSPWKDYREYGNILLSGDRGMKQHTDIGVYTNVPESVFESPEPFEWDNLET